MSRSSSTLPPSTPPPTNLSVFLTPFFLICCIFQLGHPGPNLNWILPACYLRAITALPFLCGWVRMKCVHVPRHRITSMSLSVSPLHRPQCSSFNPPTRHKACDLKKCLNTGSLFIVPFFVSHSVPAEPCPGQRGAVPTMSPASCHRGRDQRHPLPTLCSPPPARPTGQPRGWCGCRQRSMALR